MRIITHRIHTISLENILSGYGGASTYENDDLRSIRSSNRSSTLGRNTSDKYAQVKSILNEERVLRGSKEVLKSELSLKVYECFVGRVQEVNRFVKVLSLNVFED